MTTEKATSEIVTLESNVQLWDFVDDSTGVDIYMHDIDIDKFLDIFDHSNSILQSNNGTFWFSIALDCGLTDQATFFLEQINK